MRDSFHSFYPPIEEDVNSLWSSGLVICDANVLLNFYRYPETAREALLSAFDRVQERLWIPYQAGLEFHVNRLSVLAEQRSKFREVDQIIDESLKNLRNKLDTLQLAKRHSKIKVEPLLLEIDSSVSAFREELKTLEGASLNVTDADPLLDRIESLFSGKVGPPPKEQKELDRIYQEGKDRYEKMIPPGYCDQSKAHEKSGGVISFDGLKFQKSFGDYLIWAQILEHTQADEIRTVMFITDDVKEDWWNIIESDGKRRVGPRVELINEIGNQSGVEVFKMFSSDRFLSEASDRFDLGIEGESIDQVKEHRKETYGDLLDRYGAIRSAADKWMLRSFKKVMPSISGFPLFVCSDDDDHLWGVEVIPLINNSDLPDEFGNSLYPKATYELSNGSIQKFLFLFVSDRFNIARELRQNGIQPPTHEVYSNTDSISFLIGVRTDSGITII